MKPSSPITPTIKEVGVEAGVFTSTPVSSPTKKRKAESDDSPSPKRVKRQKATSKTPQASDKEDVGTKIAYCVPSVTQSSGIKILWKGISGSYRSVKEIELTETRTLTEIKHEALRL